MSFADFDKYADEQEANGSTLTTPELFGQWIANQSGNAVIVENDDGVQGVALPKDNT